MRAWMIAAFLVPMALQAQDYTRVSGDEAAGAAWDTPREGANSILVVPYHPHYMISEVDRAMTPDGTDPILMRERMRMRTTMAVTRAFADSLDALDISIATDDEAIDLLDYVYNAMDYHYASYTPVEEDKAKGPKGWVGKLKKKDKDQEVYGAYSRTREGQLDRVEVLEDRYMSAGLINSGAVEYLQDMHPYQQLLIITQLEILRDHKHVGPEPRYTAALHYSYLDAKGQEQSGGKEVLAVQPYQLDMQIFEKEVLPLLASAVCAQAQQAVKDKSQDINDNSDY